ncbi:collagen binding domain-containing protein [Streptomyces sp. NPDC087440]|uniref:MSCRAMM family protein n=1 Tax=Streptomyces sp. NPDC087440 TaxID=3365790 RepID=UPI00382DE490
MTTPPHGAHRRRPVRAVHSRALSLGLTLPLLTTGSLLGAAPAQADAGDGTVKVRVVREVNANGTWDRVLEPALNQVEVRLTDDAGTTVTARTGADGVAAFTPANTALKGGKYRAQVVNPKPGVLFSAFADHEGGLLKGDVNALTSTEEFVDVTGGQNVEFTTAFWNPGDYCQKNADLVTACIGKDTSDGPEADTRRTLVSFPYNARGNNNQTTDMATKGDTGALYGIGWSKQKKWVFSGAFARRASKYGPEGPGAIYLSDRTNGNALSLFTKVPNVGTTEHQMSTDMDLSFSPKVTKESLGDVEVSEDGKDLYVVNLNDRKLYRYDATQKTAAAPKASYDIPDPGCSSGDDWRPFGLGVQDGTVYVGGVCSAESTQNKADMRAVVQTFDAAAGNFTGVVMNQKLDYPRGIADNLPANCKGAAWYPWADGYRDQQDGKTCTTRYAYPQPILGDVVVDTDGDLILGFRDRHADQTGQGLRTKIGGGLADPSSGGDLNRACKGPDGTFVLDGNGGCTNNGTPQNNGGQPADVLEYYPGEWRTVWHLESAFSGIALSKVEDTVATSGIDVIDTTYNSGTMHVNRDGTKPSPNAQGGNILNTSFGKGGAMADLEVLCDEAPIQIGNRVWYDVDKDGIQDPGEKPVPGATVNLYDASGNKVATTKTTSRGEYYFDNSNVPGGLTFRTQYTIKIDNPADYEDGGPLFRWAVTKNDAGGNDFIDSDGKVPAGGTYPEHTITTGDAGQDNHTYDFGYNQPDGKVRIVKTDAATGKPLAGAKFQLWRESNSQDGLQMDGDTPDAKVGSVCTTDERGLCTSDDVPLGAYYWQETEAPEGYRPPVNPVFGPLVLDFDNYARGAEAKATNQPDGEVRVLKTSSATGRPLAGAKFQLWRESNSQDGLQMDGDTPDTKVGSVCTTDGRGACTSGKVPLGTYYWQETEAPEGYQPPVNPVLGPLVLDLGNVTRGAEVQAANEPNQNEPVKGEITIVKKDAKTGRLVPGAVFQLWKETNGTPGLQRTGARADSLTDPGCATDAQGRCRYEKLDEGAYYLYETAVPDGYQLPANRTSGPHRISENSLSATVTLKNEPKEEEKKKK